MAAVHALGQVVVKKEFISLIHGIRVQGLVVAGLLFEFRKAQFLQMFGTAAGHFHHGHQYGVEIIGGNQGGSIGRQFGLALPFIKRHDQCVANQHVA